MRNIILLVFTSSQQVNTGNLMTRENKRGTVGEGENTSGDRTLSRGFHSHQQGTHGRGSGGAAETQFPGRRWANPDWCAHVANHAVANHAVDNCLFDADSCSSLGSCDVCATGTNINDSLVPGDSDPRWDSSIQEPGTRTDLGA